MKDGSPLAPNTGRYVHQTALDECSASELVCLILGHDTKGCLQPCCLAAPSTTVPRKNRSPARRPNAADFETCPSRLAIIFSVRRGEPSKVRNRARARHHIGLATRGQKHKFRCSRASRGLNRGWSQFFSKQRCTRGLAKFATPALPRVLRRHRAALPLRRRAPRAPPKCTETDPPGRGPAQTHTHTPRTNPQTPSRPTTRYAAAARRHLHTNKAREKEKNTRGQKRWPRTTSKYAAWAPATWAGRPWPSSRRCAPALRSPWLISPRRLLTRGTRVINCPSTSLVWRRS